MTQSSIMSRLCMLLFLACCGIISTSTAFVVQPLSLTTGATRHAAASAIKPTLVNMHPLSTLDTILASSSATDSSTSMTVSATTLDPSAFFSGIFGSLLTTPIILAVPILAALGVAGVLAFLLVKSSEPEEDE